MGNSYISSLYIGVTNNLERRVGEHKSLSVEGFSKKYNTTLLLYYEESQSVLDAIQREKQLKGRSRIKKINLIKSINPLLRDVSV